MPVWLPRRSVPALACGAFHYPLVVLPRLSPPTQPRGPRSRFVPVGLRGTIQPCPQLFRVDMNYTSDPLSVATSAATPAEFMRLPKPKARDPIFGFSRSYLNTLVLPCRENGFRPPVRSIVLRKRGAKTGVRLVDLASLRVFLEAHVEPAYRANTASKAPGPVVAN